MQLRVGDTGVAPALLNEVVVRLLIGSHSNDFEGCPPLGEFTLHACVFN